MYSLYEIKLLEDYAFENRHRRLSVFQIVLERHRDDYEYLDIAEIQRTFREVHITFEQAYDVDIAFILEVASKLRLHIKFLAIEAVHDPLQKLENADILLKVYDNTDIHSRNE